MIDLNNIPIGETPLFEALMGGQGSETLFEDWRPESTEEFVRKHFPPFADPMEQVELIKEDESTPRGSIFGGVLVLRSA